MLPRPAKGMDQRIDKICEKIDGLKESLKVFLSEARSHFDSNHVTYVHNKRY